MYPPQMTGWGKWIRHALSSAPDACRQPGLGGLGTRSNDRLMSHDGLAGEVTGKTLTFHDDATADFATDFATAGKYAYTYGGDGTWLGR